MCECVCVCVCVNFIAMLCFLTVLERKIFIFLVVYSQLSAHGLWVGQETSHTKEHLQGPYVVFLPGVEETPRTVARLLVTITAPPVPHVWTQLSALDCPNQSPSLFRYFQMHANMFSSQLLLGIFDQHIPLIMLSSSILSWMPQQRLWEKKMYLYTGCQKSQMKSHNGHA